MDLISIVIPIYNTGEPMRACLDSVLAQTYTNLEIVLVDDHSTDPLTLEILKEYSQKDPRIKLTLNPENHGVSYCRNMGIDQCSGKFLSFLDSDDQFVPNYVERMHQVLLENDTDFAVCDVKQFRLKDDVALENDFVFPLSENAAVIDCSNFISDGKLFMVPFVVYGKMFNLQKYRLAKLYFVEELKYAEDQDWLYRLFCSQKNFSYVKFFGVKRLLRASSLVHSISENNLRSDLAAIELKYKVLRQYDYLDSCHKDFFDNCAAIFGNCLKISSSDECQQRLLIDAQERFSRMGVDFKVNPNQFDYWSCWLLYQAKRIFFVQDIEHRAMYKIYKKILRSKQQSS